MRHFHGACSTKFLCTINSDTYASPNTWTQELQYTWYMQCKNICKKSLCFQWFPSCFVFMPKLNVSYSQCEDLFCAHSFIIFTWVLHVLKDCSFPYILQKTAWKSIRLEQNNSLPNAVGVKIKSCRNSFSWTLNCIDCIGVKKVWNVLSGLTNDDSCKFWFWPLPYSTMSISIIPQSISKRLSINWFLFLAVCQTCSRNNYFYKTFILESDIPYFFWAVYIACCRCEEWGGGRHGGRRGADGSGWGGGATSAAGCKSVCPPPPRHTHTLHDTIDVWSTMYYRLQATNLSARPDVSIERSQGFQTVLCLIGC